MSKNREINPNGLYHIYNRGNNQEDIFIDNEDKLKYLLILQKHSADKRVLIYAYCVMDNHFHLYVEDLYECLSDVMRDVQARYAEYFNNKYKRSGHVFQGQFGSCIVRGYKYSIRLIRYILRNPVKARLIKEIQNYVWSSIGISNKKLNIVDPKYVKFIFENANVDFMTYINNDEEDKLIAAVERQTYKDDEVSLKFREVLLHKFNMAPEDFVHQETDFKMKIIMWCRYEGLSVRQLVETAQVTISFVRRATPKDIEYL